jgi:hypothetical protein
MDGGQHFLGRPGINELDVVDNEIPGGEDTGSEDGGVGGRHGASLTGQAESCKEGKDLNGGTREENSAGEAIP